MHGFGAARTGAATVGKTLLGYLGIDQMSEYHPKGRYTQHALPSLALQNIGYRELNITLTSVSPLSGLPDTGRHSRIVPMLFHPSLSTTL